MVKANRDCRLICKKNPGQPGFFISGVQLADIAIGPIFIAEQRYQQQIGMLDVTDSVTQDGFAEQLHHPH